MREPGTLGGRDDIVLAEHLPKLPPWKPTMRGYYEAEKGEVPPPSHYPSGVVPEFPSRGHFIGAELVSDDGADELAEEIAGIDPAGFYVQVTEALDRILVGTVNTGDATTTLEDVVVKVDTAEKAGGDGEGSPGTWHYTGQWHLRDELGPPQGQG